MAYDLAKPTLGIVLLLTLFGTPPAYAKRHDVVVMKNGDRLTGEVKRLQKGVLYLETDYVSGSIGVDWLQVEQVQSEAAYQVVLNDGGHFVGRIEKVPAKNAPGKDFEIQSPVRSVQTAGVDVVDIESQKQNFWHQLKGAIDFGYDFTSGNSQTSFSSDASTSYTTTNWSAGLDFNSSFSGQSSGSQTNLLELQGSGERFLNRNSFLLGLGDFLHSSQQQLDLRTTLGGGYGRYWFRTNHQYLRWLAGAVYTHETFQTSPNLPSDQNVEALLGAQYQLFQFDRYGLQSQIFVYPGLSDAGRLRTTTNTTLTVKLSNNFHTHFSFWDNYDSRPPATARRNELGISSALGWSF